MARNFLLIILLYLLGFTHFLGGPYWLAKFFFFVFLIGVILFSVFAWGTIKFTSKIFKNNFNNSNSSQPEKEETIKVDAKIIE